MSLQCTVFFQVHRRGSSSLMGAYQMNYCIILQLARLYLPVAYGEDIRLINSDKLHAVIEAYETERIELKKCQLS